MKQILFFFALAALSHTASPQCDPESYEQLKHVPKPFELLKRYSIDVREIPGAPFSAKYSYVFTKGNTYAFALKESIGNPAALNFSLTNNDGDVENSRLKSVVYGDRELLVFHCRKTGIYFFTIYTEKSFNGCAVLQLSYTQEPIVVPSDPDEAFNDTFNNRVFEDHQLLKKFELGGDKTSEYSYVLTKDRMYAVYIERKDQSRKGIDLDVRDAKKKLLRNDVAEFPLPNGVLYVIYCKNTGIYYLNFKIDDGMYSLARLSTIEKKVE